MKNFLFLIGIVLIVVACNQNKTSSSSQTNDSSIARRTATAPPPVAWALNGYDSTKADIMVRNFLTNKGVYNRAARTNIWFGKDYLDRLIALLEKEKTIDKSRPGADTVDGIRVYFAKEKPNEYGFILVSTRCKLKDPTKHYDYFDHSDPYFNSKRAEGDIDRNTIHGNHPGALLYDENYKCKGDNCNPKAKHYVKCDSAIKWVTNHKQHNQFGKKDTLNTTSEWFDLNLLKEIQGDLILTTKSGRTPDGIRIYYARKNYPETYYPYLHRHNLIIVTTETINGKPRQDYFDCPHKLFQADDNGEQCRNQCDGTTWADVASN